VISTKPAKRQKVEISYGFGNLPLPRSDVRCLADSVKKSKIDGFDIRANAVPGVRPETQMR
jgi:hypothetical protein